jgi:radical SAM/Cys-rich protein
VSFQKTLQEHGLELQKDTIETLQVNVGLLCNLSCGHCHLEAGPERAEVMSSDTVRQVIEFAQRGHFRVIDVTGGAPELNPNIEQLLSGLAPLTPRTMLRTNLIALDAADRKRLIALCRELRLVVVASLPSLNRAQADSQRGPGNFEPSLSVLRQLNSIGYGRPGSDLELNLVVNPTGAFLPTSQEQAEKRFREVLQRRWGIEFSQLFCFANVPLGRYRSWLTESGNLESYLNKLKSNFNASAVSALMCRNQISVDWEGFLYDCDFNLARGLHIGEKKIHISELDDPPRPGNPIAIDDHCYACTAGAGFTCGGAIAA